MSRCPFNMTMVKVLYNSMAFCGCRHMPLCSPPYATLLPLKFYTGSIALHHGDWSQASNLVAKRVRVSNAGRRRGERRWQSSNVMGSNDTGSNRVKGEGRIEIKQGGGEELVVHLSALDRLLHEPDGRGGHPPGSDEENSKFTRQQV